MPFPIPNFWGEKVDSSLREEQANPHVRKEIVNTLCCALKVYSNGTPTRAAAMALVYKYSFLKDPIGCDYVKIYKLYLLLYHCKCIVRDCGHIMWKKFKNA